MIEKRRICCQQSSLAAAKSMLIQLSSVNDWWDNVATFKSMGFRDDIRKGLRVEMSQVLGYREYD